MAYYLAKQNTYKVGSELFGNYLDKMSFRYNKQYKYWYRLPSSQVIQFFGIAQYQGGVYDISFISQPLYVPLFYPFFNEKRGKAPNYNMFNGSSLIRQMQQLGYPDLDSIPLLGGWSRDSQSDIIKHMVLTFDTIIKDYLENSTDCIACYHEYKKLDSIRIDYVKKYSSYERWYKISRKTNLFEILILLDNKEYDKVIEIINSDNEIRKEDHTLPLYEKYLAISKTKDQNSIDNLLISYYNQTINELRDVGFVL